MLYPVKASNKLDLDKYPTQSLLQNGLPKVCGNFNSSGKKEGKWYTFSFLILSKKENTYKHYLNFIKTYHKGKLQGWTSAYTLSGKITTATLYDKNWVIEKRRFNYTTGLMIEKYSYRKGLLHGESRQYTPRGLLFSKTTWKHNLKHGTEICYYRNFRVVASKKKYRIGKLHGLSFIYDSKGGLISRTNFVNNLEEGWERIEEKGKVVAMLKYKQGNMVLHQIVNKEAYNRYLDQC